MKVSGICIVREATRLDFPVVEVVRSLLPLVDEMIVNVGECGDGTADRVEAAFGDPRLTVLRRQWDLELGGKVLAHETQMALDAASGDWILYAQADEVLHESGIPLLRAAMNKWLPAPEVEGLLVDFVHHYQKPDRIATSRQWYRREVRAVKRNCDVRSFEEAQGFRVGPEGQRVRAKSSGAVYHHYGWCRPSFALEAKRDVDRALYHDLEPRPGQLVLPWEYGLESFRGSHPAVMRGWIEARRGSHATLATPRPSVRQFRYWLSDMWERATGHRAWEYRNYVEV